MAGASIKIGASSSEFQKQMKEVTQQLKLVSSECGLATEKAKLFGTTQEKLSAVQRELTAKIQAQNQMIQLYRDRITGINGEIEKHKNKQNELNTEIEEANKKYKESVEATGENSEESKKLKEELQKLKEEYARNERAIQNSNNRLVDATTRMNNTERAMLQNQRALEDVNEEIANVKLDELAKKFENIGEASTNIGTKMSVVSAAIVGTGTALGKIAFDTEQELSTLGGRLGLTEKEAESLKEVAKKLYSDGFGESLGECVNDVVVLQQNIKETSNMTDEQKGKLLEQISTIKTLFGAESEEITKTLNNMLTNGVIDNLDEGLDLITVGFQNGLNSGGDLLDVLYEYSPQFKKLGLDGEDALNYIKAGLDAGGYNADKMADSLKELSIRAIDGSNTTIEGFTLIGLNADEMAKKFAAGGDTAKEALNQTIEGLQNMDDPIKQDVAGVNLFGTMWEDSSKDAILAMGDIGTGLGDITGATQKAGEEVNKSIGKQFDSVLREAKESCLPLGQELLNLAQVALPMLKGVLQNVTSFLKGLSDEGRRNILAISGIVAAIGPTLIALGSFSKGISNIINGYKDMKEFGGKALEVVKDFGSKAVDTAKSVGSFAVNLGKTAIEFGKTAIQAGIATVKTIAQTVATNAMAAAQAALNFIMSLNPITLIIIGITALIATIILLWNKCEWFRNLCMQLFEVLKVGWNITIEFFKTVWDGFVVLWNSAIEGLKVIWSSICDFFKLIWKGVCLYFETVWNVWKTVFNTVINAIKVAWQGICNALKLAWQVIVDFIKQVWQGWKNIFQSVGIAIRTIWQGLCNTMSNIWNGIVNTIKSVWNGFKSVFTSVGNTIKSVWQGIGNTISSVWNKVVNGVKNAWNGIISPFRKVINSIGNMWKGIKSLFKTPHFTISGTLNPLKWADEGVPKIGVKWYWKGGIFKSPTLLNGIGVGDAFNGQGSNAEAIVPLDEMYRNIQGIIRKEQMSQPIYVVVNVANNMDNKAIGKAVTTEVKKVITRGTNNYIKGKGGLVLG